VKSQWSKIGQLLHPKVSTGIRYIDKVDPEGSDKRLRLHDPCEIEAAILQRNIHHFGQAQGSPFTIPPITDMLSYQGAEDIASIDTSLLSIGPELIIQHLQHMNEVQPISTFISLKEFKSILSKWDESTTTSPSGRHLGHYKVLLLPDRSFSPASSNNSHTMTSGDQILQLYCDIINISIQNGHSLQRWQKSTTTMIEKIPGCPRLDKLRVIHLFEADYNLVLKVLWGKRLVENADSMDLLHQGQSGSRPNRRCVDVVLGKTMKYEYALLTRTSLAVLDNDAKACYDRIVCNLASTVSKKFGMPANAVRLQAATLENMRYNLRTALRDSTVCYQHSQKTPIHGTGQGSCSSPSLWLLISSVLMKCLSAHGNGMMMKSVSNKSDIKDIIEGFVDDTSIFGNIGQDISAVMSNFSADANLWNTLLNASGGLLEFSKCFYYLLSWSFDKGGNPVSATTAEQVGLHTGLVITDVKTNISKPIEQKEPTEAHRTLGVHLNILGTYEKQCHVLFEQSVWFASRMKLARLSRYQTSLAFRCSYMPMILYSASACNLTDLQINTPQNVVVNSVLSGMGYNRSTPKAIVFGPARYGGISLRIASIEANLMKLESVLNHIRSGSGLGKQMQNNLEWYQLVSGTGTPVLSRRTTIDYIDDNWFKGLHSFLLRTNASLHFHSLWRPIPARIGDQVLMDVADQMNLIPAYKKYINNWRLFFQVNLLSDLCNQEGTHILPLYYNIKQTERHHPDRSSLLNWPVQPMKGNGGRYWREFLSNFIPGHKSANGKLKTALGPWIVPSCKQDSSWRWHLSNQENSTYEIRNQQIRVRRMVRGDAKVLFTNIKSDTTVMQLPWDCFPTAPMKWLVQYRHTRPAGTSPLPDERIPIPPRLLVIDADTGMPEKLKVVKVFASGSIIKQTVVAARIVIVDDIEQQPDVSCVYGPSDVTGYRAAISSIQVALQTITSVTVTDRDITHGEIYSDNKGAIGRLRRHITSVVTLKDYNHSDIDVELICKGLWGKLRDDGVTITLHYLNIGGDTSKDLEHAAYNEILLRAARTCALNHIPGPVPPLFISNELNPIDLKINNEVTTSGMKAKIRFYGSNRPLINYLKTKHDWSAEAFNLIWWSCHSRAIGSFGFNDRIRLHKIIHDMLPTHSLANKISPNESPVCRCCNLTEENFLHVFRCTHKERTRQRTESLSTITSVLNENTTSETAEKITARLKCLLNEVQIPVPQNDTSLVKDQDILGWVHFLRGRVPVSWNQLFSEAGMTRVITVVWQQLLVLWKCRNDTVYDQTSVRENILEKLRQKAYTLASYLRTSNAPLAGSIPYQESHLEQLTALQLRQWFECAEFIRDKVKQGSFQDPNQSRIDLFFSKINAGTALQSSIRSRKGKRNIQKKRKNNMQGSLGFCSVVDGRKDQNDSSTGQN
jgi:Reverse transcriptase (RNA-dependent DNA polymerase)